MTRPMHKYGIRALVGAATGLAVALVVGVTTAAKDSSQPVGPGQLAVELHAAGLDPDSLASAGFSAAQTTSAVSQVQEDFTTLGLELQSARLALHDASDDRARLASIVRSGTSTPEQREALAAAYDAEQAARLDLADAVLALSSVATEGLPSNLVQVLGRIESNSGHDLPTWHRATVRDDAEWRDIRYAVASERIHQSLGASVPASVQGILSTANADPAVAAARANYETNGVAVAVAWHDAIWR